MCIVCALYKVCSYSQMRTQSSIYRLWGQTQLVLALGARKLSTNQKRATSFHPSSFLLQLAPKQFKRIVYMKLAQGNMYLAQGNRSGFLAPLGARRNFFLVPGVAQGRNRVDELAQGEI